MSRLLTLKEQKEKTKNWPKGGGDWFKTKVDGFGKKQAKQVHPSYPEKALNKKMK